jgi:hypothetical protein
VINMATKQLSTRPLNQQTRRTIAALTERNIRDYRSWRNMLRDDSVTGIANKSLTLLISGMIGGYEHPDKRLKDNVDYSFAQMVGTPKDLWDGCCSMLPYGFAIAPVKYTLEQGKYRLDQVLFLPQEEVKFKIEYNQIQGYRALDTDFQYLSKLHLINERYVTPGITDPRGVALCGRAYPIWMEHLQNELVRSHVTHKQGAKLLVGKTDTTDVIEFADDGVTEVVSNAGETMRDVLVEADTTDVVVVSREDEVMAVDWTTTGEFFERSYYQFQVDRFRAFYHPQTIFGGNKSGVGDAGLAAAQSESLLSFCEEIARYITAQFTEQVLRPMLEQNFGSQGEGYGSFTINRPNEQALEIAKIVLEVIRLGDPEGSWMKKLEGLIGG